MEDKPLNEKQYFSANTGLFIVDQCNDPISEDGKLWSLRKETVKGANLIENLKNLLYATRSSGIKVVYMSCIVRLKKEPTWIGTSRAYTRGLFENSLFEEGS